MTNLNGKPLVVLTADTGNAADWQAKQDQIATLSINTSHPAVGRIYPLSEVATASAT